jgi:hypothetical protein
VLGTNQAKVSARCGIEGPALARLEKGDTPNPGHALALRSRSRQKARY